MLTRNRRRYGTDAEFKSSEVVILNDALALPKLRKRSRTFAVTSAKVVPGGIVLVYVFRCLLSENKVGYGGVYDCLGPELNYFYMCSGRVFEESD
ncbi:hypothetical protein JTB14_035420 [Gonioctena quinquepunctata]|nr:hypothetical protein JTB14_035420 [Gonioctena quinquepunctata]